VYAAAVAGKFIAIGLGLAFVGIGSLFIAKGGRLTAALNAMYTRLPGRFQYPAWYHRAFGGFIVGFGILIASVGGTLAH
jgi:hypothetical protein